ncbi:DUF3088 domain-containing protein [Cupriavidus consociatus]|uniref:DUF3088 domain-containing protein n=1 Tax=Cupriavidus consociatus TaxID=2821357 RepID=UPI001AE585E5|nr:MULTISPECIES: DUF3088 domain-containing protein [unclassified Cupriavidus]MBP0624416.1 DUF3088 domain-containing protein [Cupriavidus sp. LEh25]MDK2661128.1 DUF3088 domain-containing protein [Cupriavidus sp. LEh21]
MKDKLLMLRPGFTQGTEGPFYCGDAVAIEGLLSFFPQLRSQIEVEYIDALRPRKAIVDLIGEANQSAPVLVLGGGREPVDNSVEVRMYGQTRFVNSPDHIRRYLSSQYGVPRSTS